METPTSQPRVIYDSIKDVVDEWHSSKDERAIWEYLGVDEYVFKEWVKKCRDGVIDA